MSPTATKKGAPYDPAVELLRGACGLSTHNSVKHLLVISDDIKQIVDQLKPKSLKKKLLLAVSNDALKAIAEEEGLQAIQIPAYSIERMEKVKLAQVAAFSAGLVEQRDKLVCLVGETHDLSSMDALLLLTFGKDKLPDTRKSSWTDLRSIAEDVPVQLLEVLLEMARAIGQVGYEGRPTGTILVVGDSTAVMEKSSQLHLNPLQGYSETERNIMDPAVRQAVMKFAILDGATIIRNDGVVLASGRYLEITGGLDLGMGLGTRHQASAAITSETNAIAIAISQTTGEARIFKHGKVCLELQPGGRRTFHQAVVPPPKESTGAQPESAEPAGKAKKAPA